MTTQTPVPVKTDKWLRSGTGFSQNFDSCSGCERKA